LCLQAQANSKQSGTQLVPVCTPLQLTNKLCCFCHVAADIKAELVKLNKGLLFLFLELVTVLVQQPSGYSSALSPVLITLHNMMHLINMARHHQVRPAALTMYTAVIGRLQPYKATSQGAARQHNWHAASCGRGLGTLNLRLLTNGSSRHATACVPELPNWLNIAQCFAAADRWVPCHAGS
jgi:hypothetical protein